MVLWSVFSLCGCGSEDVTRRASSDSARRAYPLRIVCTTGHVADLLRNIGGDHVAVEALMGSGVDPHLYKATPSGVRRLMAADVVFYSGLHLEGRLASLLEKLGRRKAVYAVTEDLALAHAEEHPDPHVWFDVSLWAQCIDAATRRLIALDPEHAEDYRRNAAAYSVRLAELHAWCGTRLAEIPRQQRVLVTAHDAFGHFGRAYDIEVRGLQGLSTTDEADLQTVGQLVDLLAERKIKAVFVESSVPAKNVRALVEACAARGHETAIGGELFSDALGSEGTDEATYVGVVRFNVKTIVEALK